MNIERCAICKPNHKTIYVHKDIESHEIWLYCNKCQRAFSLYNYCAEAGISMKEFLSENITFEEAQPNEVRKMERPSWFVSPYDYRAKKGLDYLASRKIDPAAGDVFYDLDSEAIIFPYYYRGTFVGAQRRFIKPKVVDGKEHKIDTMAGTRLGLLFYNFDQLFIPPSVKALIITEGAFNSLSLQQSLNRVYGSYLKNPYKCMATSGSGLSQHQIETLQEKKSQGLKVVMAPDYDEAGRGMLEKASYHNILTHYSFTQIDADWNQVLIQSDEKKLLKVFFDNLIKV